MSNKNNDAILYPLKLFSYKYDESFLVKGQGIYLYDETGKKYIDGISGLWNVPLGYCNEKIDEAITNQMKNISYVNLFNNNTPIISNYANALIEVIGNDFSRIIYTCSGSESIEVSIKLCRKAFKILNKDSKNKVVVMDMSYHGTTYAAMAASGMDKGVLKDYSPVVEGFIRALTPFCTCCEPNDMSSACKEKFLLNLNNIFIKHGEEIAATIIEPVIGSGGIIPIPKWYMDELNRLSKAHGAFLIFDEVATGFGRTGQLFAFQNFNIKPDIVCLSKAINNGSIPMGLTVINNRIENLFIDNNEYIEHFSTQNGNPLACAAAMETLNVVNDEIFLKNISDKGEVLKNALKRELSNLSVIRDIRGKGLMIGIDLVDKNKKPITMKSVLNVEKTLRKKGLIVYPFYVEGVCTGISLFPPYICLSEQLDHIVGILQKVLIKLFI